MRAQTGSPPAGGAGFVCALSCVAIWLGYWALAKYRLFEGLEYTSDLFLVLQQSRGWLAGQPILYDNAFGFHIHNYFVLLLLAPLTRIWSAYGLFAAYLILLLVTSVCVYRALPSLGSRMLFASLFLGPIGYWVWDDPVYGYHAENFFLPLGVLYAIALLRRSTVRWVLMALLCLTQEQGALVAMAIHVAAVLLRAQQDVSRALQAQRAGLILIARLVAGYGLLFGLGMLMVTHDARTGSRLSAALDGLRLVLSNRTSRDLLAADLMYWCLLILPVLLVAALYRRQLSTLTVSILCLAPVLAVAVVGRMLYRTNELGPTWPPRFAPMWAIGLAILLFSMAVSPRPHLSITTKTLLVLGICGLVAYQAAVLRLAREYRFYARLRAADTELVSRRFGAEEIRMLDCLGRRLDMRTAVAAAGDLFDKFHRQTIVWPDRVSIAWRKPDIVVCDTQKRAVFEYGCNALADASSMNGFGQSVTAGLRVAFAPPLRPVVQACAISVLPRDALR